MTLRISTRNTQVKLDDFQALGANVNAYFNAIRTNVLGTLATEATFMLSAIQAAIAFSALLAAGDADLVTAYRRETGQTGAQVQADAAAALSACNAVIAAMVAAYPLDGSRRMLDRTMDASGNTTAVMLPAASLVAVSTAIDGWRSAIL